MMQVVIIQGLEIQVMRIQALVIQALVIQVQISIWKLDASATKPLPVNLLNRGHLGLSAFQKSSTNTNALHRLMT